MIPVKEVFTADPFGTLEMLSGTGIGYYIPPYQRDYYWDSNQIDRFFDDISHGPNSLVNR